jgi:surface antigen
MSRRFHGLPYNGTRTARLWRVATLAAPLVWALGCGGCSMSLDAFESFTGKSGDKTEVTGSINSGGNAKLAAIPMPPERDLVFTRAAIAEALSREAKDVSLPWENPESGARGTVTPIASAYTQDGSTCRDFLASFVSGHGESWMRGEACRATKGKWEIRALKPWTRS